MPVRSSNARWEGSIGSGQGTMAFGSGAYEGTYSAPSRFEDAEGTNPEELIAAAHAGCFSMALAAALTRGKTPPTRIDTTADVHIEKVGEGWEITRIDLRTEAEVPGLTDTDFQQVAAAAKENCPVSKALKSVAEVTLEAKLVG